MMDVPDAALGVNTQPNAVPAFEKSDAAIPDTDSPNVMPNVSDIAAAGEEGCDENDAVGASTSMVTVGASVLPYGPFCPEEPPNTEFDACVNMTVPDVADAPLMVMVYGPEPLPVTEEIDQPVLVPPIEKSLAVRPVTDS